MCVQEFDDDEDGVLYERALNLLSHGKFSIYDPVAMGDDTKDLFTRILNGFLVKYKFDLPELLKEPENKEVEK